MFVLCRLIRLRIWARMPVGTNIRARTRRCCGTALCWLSRSRSLKANATSEARRSYEGWKKKRGGNLFPMLAFIEWLSSDLRVPFHLLLLLVTVVNAQVRDNILWPVSALVIRNVSLFWEFIYGISKCILFLRVLLIGNCSIFIATL